MYKALALCVLLKNIGNQGGFLWVSSQNGVKSFSLKNHIKFPSPVLFLPQESPTLDPAKIRVSISEFY